MRVRVLVTVLTVLLALTLTLLALTLTGRNPLTRAIGTARDSTFVVRLRSATSGTPFALACIATQADGSSASQQYSGFAPAEYSVKAHSLSCAGKNSSLFGDLTMEITLDGQVLNTSHVDDGSGTLQATAQ